MRFKRLTSLAVLFSVLLFAAASSDWGYAQNRHRQLATENKKRLTAPDSASAAIETDKHYQQLLASPQVRVFRLNVGPGEATKTLYHPHDYLVIAIGESEIEAVGEANRFLLKMRAGEVRVLTGGWSHQLANRAPEPANLVVVELGHGIAPQESICGLTAEACHETHFGKNDFGRYSQTMLFETKKVRLLRAELGPGGVLPEHNDLAEHLIVTLTNTRLSDGLDRPAGHALRMAELRTVRNVGDKDAQLLIVEIK